MCARTYCHHTHQFALLSSSSVLDSSNASSNEISKYLFFNFLKPSMVNPTPLAAYTNVAKYTNPSTIVRTVIEICLAVYDSGKVELSNPLETLLAKMYNTVDIAMPVKPPVNA